MSSNFNELFVATLSMFGLDKNGAQSLDHDTITVLFKTVLKAQGPCKKIYDEQNPSVYEKRGVQSI